MELKTKYQYSYFIYPYVIDEKKYDKYMLKLLKDKHCNLKMFEKEKDLNIYTYFLPKVRNYLFWSFAYDSEHKNKLEKLDVQMKSVLISKYPCTVFEYTLGKEVQAKIGEQNGIFFSIAKMEIVCFKTGICFLLIKTILDEQSTFSNVLNFNYKFREINSELAPLKDYENIRLQTNSFKDIKELSDVIKDITNNNKDAKELNLEKEKFLTYSYTCIDQENWKNEEDFSNLEEEFIKFSNVLPSKNQVNYNKEWTKNQRLDYLKNAKIGFTKQATVLLTSTSVSENYTKLPFAYENEYLYTYIFTLYKKIYLKKLSQSFKKNKNFENAKNAFLEFTRDIWLQEVTLNDQGSILYNKWKQILDVEYLYSEIKSKFDIEYKQLNFEKSKKINYFIIALLIGIFIFNIANFINLLTP